MVPSHSVLDFTLNGMAFQENWKHAQVEKGWMILRRCWAFMEVLAC